ncbi:MAG TPA: serine/threonine-protein kinase [Allosphingosinicella sp.]
MTTREAEALEIVEAALDLAGAKREAFIASRCAGRPALEARVRAILAMEEAQPASLSTRVMAERHARAEPVPERVGKFRVTGKIGGGGMGMVVRAERDDGVYSQTVAIKLIRSDLRDERDRERFANERRLLARLSHPSIARILDGGEQDGRPYLVMELVEGRPVTDDLAERRADVGETLAVFERVAAAVSHAHRNLVIHGDIKPANIFATADGAVKLLDFGIGRLAGDLDSGAEAYPLTPAFAAPERVNGEPPSVAGDVFSLGVLLHLMLAGTLPAAEGKPMSAAADGSRVPPERLRGDLDAIVGRALAPNPAERYPDVSAMAADIRRHCEQQPVTARPATLRYTAGRFFRRNRAAVAAGAAVFLLLTAATIVSLTLYFDARRQRAAAVARFEELRSLAGFQLFELYDELAEIPGSTAARARLAAEAQRYLDRLAALPDAPADLRLDVARGLDRLASVQGTPRVPNLGQPARARANLARAAALLDTLAAETPDDPAIRVERARNLVFRAQILAWLDQRAEAARPLLEAARPLAAGDSPAALEVEAMRRSAWLELLVWMQRYRDVRTAADADLAWLQRWPGGRPLAWHLLAADALNWRGDARFYLDDAAGALSDYRAAERTLTDAHARWPRRPTILARQLQSGYNVITTLHYAGRHEGLLARINDLLRRGELLLQLEAFDQALRRRHLINLDMAAQIFADAGHDAQAIAFQRRVVAEREAIARRPGAEPLAFSDVAFSRKVLGTLHWIAGRRSDACGEWRTSMGVLERMTRARQLSTWDRERNLPYLRLNLEICAGRRPASDYREPM